MTEASTAQVSAEQVRAALCTALVDLGIEHNEITDESRLHDDLELDSTEKVQVALELTRELGRKVTLKDAGDPVISDLIQVVLEQVNAPVE